MSYISQTNMVTLFSSDKDDTLYGTDNSEILRGGKGNDVLQGRGGSDTYLYGRGDGKDTIIDSGGIDTLTFDAGISADDLIIKKSGNDIIVGLRQTGVAFENLTDTVTLKNWYVQATRMDRFSFNDGTALDVNGILELMGNTDDVIYGGNDAETFSTFGGNDTIDSTTDTTPIYTPKIFTSNYEIDTIYNYFYMFEKKAVS